MKVDRVAYAGRDRLDVYLTERPDMEVVRSYVNVEPLRQGAVSFSYEARYNHRKGGYEPCLCVMGDFAHRTNVTLRIRRGFPVYGLTASSNVVIVAMEKDFSHTFRRKDEEPTVDFTDCGRYLPPMGRRTISLTSVNVSQIAADIRALPSANIVPMLALEEGIYDKIHRSWSSKDGFATDLSGVARQGKLIAANKLNEKEQLTLPIVPPEGSPSNGIFLISIANADAGRDKIQEEQCWWEENRWRHRIVCVTDLGLSVRRTEKGLYVWVTSLSAGKPVADVKVEVYSSANVLVAKGHANANGWCVCETVGAGEPFAVIVSKDDGSDRSFLAIRPSMNVEESVWKDGARPAYLSAGACTAFAWTERGIYRHEERIFFHALVRNGRGVAPSPFPVELQLIEPSADLYSHKTLMTDAYGAVSDATFSVPSDLPSGEWTFRLKMPGASGDVLGERKVRIEEFAPPQIRVGVAADRDVAPADFAFTVSAEHLYGGPARSLRCTGAVVFEDAAFSPSGWKGYHFGNPDRALKPSFRELPGATLDDTGCYRFAAPLWKDSGRPAALVKVTAQGTVFEDGGRPATARASTYCHYYPYYIGSTLGSWLRKPATGRPKVPVSCVAPDGRRLAVAKKLTVGIERLNSVYAYRHNDAGWATWDCTQVRETVTDDFELTTCAEGDAMLELPVDAAGDYVLTITDPETDVSFAQKFYLSDWGDDEVRAPLANPAAVTLSADKPFYRPGDVPRLVVKAPFAGAALVSVFRDDLLYARVVTLTHATSEIELLPVTAENAPYIDVKVSVIQSVKANAQHLAVRAHGEQTLPVRCAEDEIPVELAVHAAEGDIRNFSVEVTAAGAVATGAVAVVTVVDEGINLLTDEPTPDPIAWFARPRGAWNPLYDLYHRLLPVAGDDVLRANGIKTGGGFGAEMLGRVSPTPTRRFRPLVRWQKDVPLVGGRARVDFTLPEFAGEVRVTAVAYNSRATGAASVRRKVCPRLVMHPDAPRFVAPGDVFEITLPLANRSGADGEVTWRLEVDGDGSAGLHGAVPLRRDETTVVRRQVTAPAEPGQLRLTYTATGFGETHTATIELPVRPAAPWRETAGVEVLAPGAVYDRPQTPQFRYAFVDSPLAELRHAFEWLADYPYGCLEQTTSRIFPLIVADGLLDGVGLEAASNRAEYVAAGVKRVSSMIRQNDFVMWPDCTYAPWDREVSLYAAHFLVEAGQSGARLVPAVRERVMKFLGTWAMSGSNSVSAYACHTLALAGQPDMDRMLRLYDDRANLSLLSRARLARAFVKIGDRRRAGDLLANAAAPDSVKEAAFLTLALLELDPADARLNGLVAYLIAHRDKARLSWGTTESNAHALLALGAYYRAFPPEAGRRFVCWHKLELPDLDSCTNETSQIAITRTYRRPDGAVADLARLKRGDLVIVELRMKSFVTRDYSDLVIEDLFPGAFEPVRDGLAPGNLQWIEPHRPNWVMRSDARDDRMLVFSRKFHLEADEEVVFHYQVRVVSAGAYVVPGVAAEAMYQPELRARTGVDRLVVVD
ncbi:MAG: alpha-2-macroglobulin family protein [Kiritimatiellia bacterium]